MTAKPPELSTILGQYVAVASIPSLEVNNSQNPRLRHRQRSRWPRSYRQEIRCP